MEITYNKLVRDRIPEIIELKGDKAFFSILAEEDYLYALNNKLREEMDEYLESGEAEELADILEVLEAICGAIGIEPSQILKLKEEKAKERGSFKKRIFLETVSIKNQGKGAESPLDDNPI